MKINRTNSNFERESLIRPFGFKGGFIHEIWQTVVLLENDQGDQSIGLGTQGILWSDAQVFAVHFEAGGNALMYLLTERALQMVQGQSFNDPIQLIEEIMPELHEYGKKITGNPNLRKTFILNSLVALDNAAWLLYAHENKLHTFDEMIPERYRPAFSFHHPKLVSIPIISYSVTVDEIKAMVDQGYFFLKIKIGHPGSQSEMLARDQAWIAAVHKAIGNIKTPYTKDSKISYYFDANGRYEKKETLQRLLDFTRKIGAFDQISIIEEPFQENCEIDVSDLGIRLAADESAQTELEAGKCIEMGYKAIVLKPIAKTLSVTLKIANLSHVQNIPCFCADLTVTPILVDWNKNVAARLAPFPNLGMGLLETNGHQNYRRWQELLQRHPCTRATWMETQQGVFILNKDFYEKSGGIFLPLPYYQRLLQAN